MARGADLAWVAEALVERREEILSRWRDVSSTQPFHIGRRALAVADHIPELFDAIVDLLQRTAPPAVPSESPLQDPAVLSAAREHARVRFEQGLSAADVVTEFRLLRQEVGRAIRAEVDDDAPTGDVVGAELLVHDALDGAIALALTALSVHLEELREEFLATTVHDVLQPIAAMKGNVQMAMRQLAQPDLDVGKVAGLLQRAVAETNRMSFLLGTLSDASRLTLGRLEPRVVDADLGAFLVGQPAQDLVVQVDERIEEAARRIELERQARLGEIDLDGRASLEAATDLGGRLSDEVLDERLAGIAGDPVPGIHQADRRCRDHGLLQLGGGLALGPVEIRVGLSRVAERRGRQDWQLAGVAILERDRHAA